MDKGCRPEAAGQPPGPAQKTGLLRTGCSLRPTASSILVPQLSDSPALADSRIAPTTPTAPIAQIVPSVQTSPTSWLSPAQAKRRQGQAQKPEKAPRARRTKKARRPEGMPGAVKAQARSNGSACSRGRNDRANKKEQARSRVGALLLGMLSGADGDSGKAERLNRLRDRNAGQHYGAVGSTPGLRGQTLDRALGQAGATGQIPLVRCEWAGPSGPLCAGWPVGCHVLDCLSVWPGWSEVCLALSALVVSARASCDPPVPLPICLHKFVRADVSVWSGCPIHLARSV